MITHTKAMAHNSLFDFVQKYLLQTEKKSSKKELNLTLALTVICNQGYGRNIPRNNFLRCLFYILYFAAKYKKYKTKTLKSCCEGRFFQ
jgi:hypothetical protein